MERGVNTELQKADTAAVSIDPEQTWPGPVYSPAVDIFESEDSITILADMPGVKAQELNIDLRDGVLSLNGRVDVPEGDKESDVLREFQTGMFSRRFSLTETVDQAKIEAQLSNGVLRLRLPKVESARPRQITVRAG
jgi:HSP20 family protein